MMNSNATIRLYQAITTESAARLRGTHGTRLQPASTGDRMALFKVSRRHAQQAARDVWAAREGEAFVYELIFHAEALGAFPQTTVAYEHQREFAVPVEHLGALSRGLAKRPRCVDSVSRPQWGGEQVMLSALVERWPIGVALSTP